MRARFSRPLVLTIVVALAPMAMSPRRAAADEAPDAKATARVFFEKGLAASADQRFAEALADFERAYELAPDYRVLYNIGKVRVLLGRFVEAIDAFAAYLDRGGADLAGDRQQEVRDAIAASLAHVVTVSVRVSLDGADVRVDGKLVGRSPLAAPVRLAEGKHTLEALIDGQPPQLREVDLPGGSTTELELAFPPPAKLEVPAAPSLPAAAPALVAPAEPSTAPSHRGRLVGYGVAGVGLVTPVVGAIVAYSSATDANAARARLVAATNPPADVMRYDAAKVDFDTARTRNELGWALVVGGGAALAVGGALVFIRPAPEGRGLAFGGTW